MVEVAIRILTWGAICSIPGEIPIFQGKVRVVMARGYCVSVSLSHDQACRLLGDIYRVIGSWSR